MPGPLPNPSSRRRNAPAIPTTSLPADGREGPAPICPLELGSAGAGWWAWAWSLPQAAGWSAGDAYFVAHRASLEDDLVAMSSEDFDVSELLGVAASEVSRRVNDLFRRVKALAAGKVGVTKTMTDMDDRLGLTPKGMAALRWKIVETQRAEVKSLRSVPKMEEDPRRSLSG